MWVLDVVVELLSHVQLFVTPWTAECQASLSFTISWSLLKLMSDSCSNSLSQWCHPTISSSVTSLSSCPQSLPASGSFPVSWLFTSKDWSFNFSISPFNEYSGLISLGLTGLISLLSKGFSRVFSSTTVENHQFFGSQPSLWSIVTSVHDKWKKHSSDYTDLCQ